MPHRRWRWSLHALRCVHAHVSWHTYAGLLLHPHQAGVSRPWCAAALLPRKAARCSGHCCLPVQPAIGMMGSNLAPLRIHSGFTVNCSQHACPCLPCAATQPAPRTCGQAPDPGAQDTGGRYNRRPGKPVIYVLQRARLRAHKRTPAERVAAVYVRSLVARKSPALPQLTFRACEEPLWQQTSLKP